MKPSPPAAHRAPAAGSMPCGNALVDLLLHQRRQHPAGADGVAGHGRAAVSSASVLVSFYHAVLGRHIGRFVFRRHQPVHRRHVDDAPQLRSRIPAAPIGRRNTADRLDGENGVHFPPGIGSSGAIVLNAGVVHQNIHAANSRSHSVHHVHYLGRIRARSAP